MSGMGEIYMKLPDITSIKTRGQAQDLAIQYQDWASKHELSYGELNEFQIVFENLANEFGLYAEFKENGII